jgi:hypothetical protein
MDHTVWVQCGDSSVEIEVRKGNLVVHAGHKDLPHDGQEMFTINDKTGDIEVFKGGE